jgi:hypothetical protein
MYGAPNNADPAKSQLHPELLLGRGTRCIRRRQLSVIGDTLGGHAGENLEMHSKIMIDRVW